MFLHVVEARHLGGYRLWLRFNNGDAGTVDLEQELDGEVFEALKDPSVFARFSVDPEIETVMWENGADLAPEFLHAQLQVQCQGN